MNIATPPPSTSAPRRQVAWHIIRAYWVSADGRPGWRLLAAVIALDLLLVWRAARITYWQKDFYDALQKLDEATFWRQLALLVLLALTGLVLNTARTWLAQSLEMRWRAWMTGVYLQRWLEGNAFYRLELAQCLGRPARVENVDQRVAEDLRMLASNTLGLGLGLLSNIVGLFTFSAIVWGLSGALAISFQGGQLHLPGYMLWVALLYAIAGSWAMEKIGGRMVQVDYRQQQAEADFRAALMRIRESAEQIALYGGGQAEHARLTSHFDAVRRNWRDIMTYTKRITIADNAYTEAGALVPYVLQGPRLFQGVITLGDLTQLIQSFMRVRVALSWFIYKYKDLALLRSVLARLAEFDAALQATRGTNIDGDMTCASDGTGTGTGTEADTAAKLLPRRLGHLDADAPSGAGQATDMGKAQGKGKTATACASNTSRTTDRQLQFDSSHSHRITRQRGTSGYLLQDVQALGPDARALTPVVNWRIDPGQRWLLHGPSGAGKSTLMRVLSGLWTHGHGHIVIPPASDPVRTTASAGSNTGLSAILFVPQRSYLPIATLRACLAYPAAEHSFSDDACQAALHWACLPMLSTRLHEQVHWAVQLSPGEQQRLAFARIWLHRPQWLFLDEATSALDEETEQRLYTQLLQDMPSLSLVSIAHRSSLRRFHDHEKALSASA